jgi:hypothetical protein
VRKVSYAPRCRVKPQQLTLLFSITNNSTSSLHSATFSRSDVRDMGENSTSYKTALVPAWKSLLFGESSKKIDFYCYSLIHPEIAEKNLSRKTLFIETSVKL